MQSADGPEPAVRFALFGGARVSRDGVPVEVSQPKQRAILGLLLAAVGEPVPLSELIDTLWPGDPAVSVTNQIHRHIGALRRLFEPALLRRQVGRYLLPSGSGYRLVVDADTSDVLRFRSLVAQARQLGGRGRRVDAVRAYLEALTVAAAPAGEDSLWHLPVFVGLEDERLTAINAAVVLCESADEYAAVLPIVRAAAARHRLNEPLNAHLMIALSRVGRASDALSVYEQLRTLLSDELGAEPGPALRGARAEASRGAHQPSRGGESSGRPVGDPALRMVPAQLPAPLSLFAGRRAVLQGLRAAPLGPREILLITGMAGVGKTTVALSIAADLAPQHPDGQLYLNLRGFDATAAPTPPLDALRDVLESLGVPATAQPVSLDARAGLFRSLLANKRALVVLDNAHDFRQVEALLPGGGQTRVIVTSRHAMPGLVAFHHARSIQLEPFDDDEMLEFFTQRLGSGRVQQSQEAITRLGQACSGLPLALAIVTARATANPTFPLALFAREFAQQRTQLEAFTTGTAELDLGVVFSWSTRGLSEDADRAFAYLAAHPGPEISVAAAASIIGVGTRRVGEVLAELVMANLLRETRPGRYTLHDLLREHAFSLLAGETPEATRRLINHYVGSAREAVRSFGQSSVSASDDVLPDVVPETFASSAEAIAWYAEERHVLHQVIRVAMSYGDYRSALTLMLDWRPMSQAVDPRHDMLPFAELAIQAAERVDEPKLRAEGFRDAAANLARTGERQRAQSLFELAATIFERADDLIGQADTYRTMALTVPMDAIDRERVLRQSVVIARQTGERPLLVTALHSLAVGLIWNGQFAEALPVVDECMAVTSTMPEMAYLEPHLLSGRARALAGIGQLNESAVAAERALPLLAEQGLVEGELRLLRIHGDTLTKLGRISDAAAAWRRFLALATRPEVVGESNAPDDDTDPYVTINEIQGKLADLTG